VEINPSNDVGKHGIYENWKLTQLRRLFLLPLIQLMLKTKERKLTMDEDMKPSLESLKQEPIPTRGREQDTKTLERRRTNQSSRAPLSRSQSSVHGGQDGYSVFSNDDDQNEIGNAGEAEPKTDEERVMRERTKEEGILEVKFDENDPLNPRNMGTMRKWAIVLILSASSLCV
jgi:hypothetical protein